MNSFSILHNFNQPLYSPDIELSQNVLAFKQGKLYENRAKLQSAVDNFSMLDVYKDVDKQYVEDRLQSVIDITNKYAGGDLSSDSLTNHLLKNVDQVVDNNVKNAVLSTRVFKAEQAEKKRLRTEDPDLFNQTNYDFSMQASEKWRTSGQVGEVYKGGGDILPYVDVNKTFMDNIPKMEEMLKAKWIETGPQEGYFRSVSTYEAVDRGQMDQALNTLLGDKERTQLRINAWGQYGSLDETQLKGEYDAYFDPQLEDAQAKLDNYNGLIAKESDPVKKERLARLRDNAESQVENLKSNSFENVVEGYGTKGAYSTLYSRQFKDNYLNAYSYAPREIEREVDEVDVANRNYEQKLIANEQWERNFALDVRSQEFDEAQAIRADQLKYGAGASTTPGLGINAVGGQAPLLGQGFQIESNGDVQAALKQQQDLESTVIQDVKNLFGGNVSTNQLLELRDQLGDNFLEKESITFNGKKVALTPEISSRLLAFKNTVLDDSPLKKLQYQEFDKLTGNILNTLTHVVQGNGDWDASESPDFNFQFVEDKATGKMKYAPLREGHGNNYASLLNLEKRTPAQELTLKTYVTYHLLGDPEVDETYKKELFNNLQRNTLRNVPSSDLSKLPNNYQGVSMILQAGKGKGTPILIHSDDYSLVPSSSALKSSNSFIKEGVSKSGAAQLYAPDGFEPQFKRLYDLYKESRKIGGSKKAAIDSKIKYLERQLGSEINLVKSKYITGSDYYLSEIEGASTEWWNAKGQEKSAKGINTIIKDEFDALGQSLETSYAKKGNRAEARELIFSEQNGATYESLKSLVGLDANSKKPITLYRAFEDGVPQEKFYYKFQTGTKEGQPTYFGGNKSEEAVVDVRSLNDAGIQVGTIDRTDYDASFGDLAPSIPLGGNDYRLSPNSDNYTNSKYSNAVSTYGDRLPMSTGEVAKIIQSASAFGPEAAEKVKQEVRDFDNSKYKFKIVPVDGSYQYVMTLGGNEVFRAPTGLEALSKTAIDDIISNTKYYVDYVFHLYLQHQYSTAERNSYKTQSQQQQRSQLLGQ